MASVLKRSLSLFIGVAKVSGDGENYWPKTPDKIFLRQSKLALIDTFIYTTDILILD